jgi:hypothetical protein
VSPCAVFNNKDNCSADVGSAHAQIPGPRTCWSSPALCASRLEPPKRTPSRTAFCSNYQTPRPSGTFRMGIHSSSLCSAGPLNLGQCYQDVSLAPILQKICRLPMQASLLGSHNLRKMYRVHSKPMPSLLRARNWFLGYTVSSCLC